MASQRDAESVARFAERAQDGDQDAFGWLYRRYREAVYRTCLKCLKDPALADDVTQESFIKAFLCIRGYDTTRPFLPWLLTIATRRCSDFAERGAKLMPKDPSDEIWLEQIEEDRPLRNAIEREERERLNKALHTLPARQRRALLLHVLEGWNYVDIASAEGTSLLSVKSLIFRARAQLRELSAQGLLGAVLLPISRVRRRMSERARRTMYSGSADMFSGALANQIATGLVALSLGVGGLGAVAVAATGAPNRAASTVAMSTDASHNSLDRGQGRTGAETFGTNDLANDVKDLASPNRNVSQPEDTHVDSITPSPHSESDGTYFAIGRAYCKTSCDPVLFRSIDSGKSWQRLPATGFNGDQIILPPNYGATDNRIFAMGQLGLQVSTDGGKSFGFAVPTARVLVGSAAISPLFDKGDRRILIGAQALVEYDDNIDNYIPSPYSALPGPLEPAFSPTFATDHLLMVGGTHVDPKKGRQGSVFSCTTNVCTETKLAGATPKIRFGYDYERSRSIAAFDSRNLFVSRGASGFAGVSLPWNGRLRDVGVLKGSTMVAAIVPEDRSSDAGLYLTVDAGRSWTQVTSQLFSRGATTIAIARSRLLVGLPHGIACSTDEGQTWQTRC